jgi:UDP-2,3-diacylglucosamine hydrolase|tara:strand:- start:34102 stop:34875 length:774 start_codon:yes stop_codon:yes gene_type:complete
MKTLSFPKTKKIYFASDQHLGAPSIASSKIREEKFLKWLNYIEKDVGALFLLGDLFDFWFEYKSVVPKGFVRVLGKLGNLSDKGIPIYFFVGNHDLWMENYFIDELGIQVFFKPQEFSLNGKSFLIGHGDGLGPGDYGYKRMKKLFTNPISKFLFRWIHPDIGVKFAQYLSINNKLISGDEDVKYNGPENEIIYQYVLRKQKEKFMNFYIFGHRHLPLDLPIEKSRYINLGDWINHFTFAEFSNDKLILKPWKINND